MADCPPSASPCLPVPQRPPVARLPGTSPRPTAILAAARRSRLGRCHGLGPLPIRLARSRTVSSQPAHGRFLLSGKDVAKQLDHLVDLIYHEKMDQGLFNPDSSDGVDPDRLFAIFSIIYIWLLLPSAAVSCRITSVRRWPDLVPPRQRLQCG